MNTDRNHNTCGRRPEYGTARCDRPAGHDGKCSAELAIGGRLSFTGRTIAPLHVDGPSLEHDAIDSVKGN